MKKKWIILAGLGILAAKKLSNRKNKTFSSLENENKNDKFDSMWNISADLKDFNKAKDDAD